MTFKYISVLLIFFFLGNGCTKKTAKENNFYYWKTTYQLNDNEKQALKINQSTRIYYRLCDIELGYDQKPHPKNVLMWNTKPEINLDYVPVLFIENSVFQSLTELDSLGNSTAIKKELIADLAKKIYRLAKTSVQFIDKNVTEIQLDCDWTVRTKDAYFFCLQELKKQNTKVTLSATIRLYQLKYTTKAGIPPIDKAILMCYNMGDLRDAKAENSIFDLDLINDYIPHKLAYNNIPISIALPIYSWYLAYRNEQFVGIVRDLSQEELENNFTKQDHNHYRCTTSQLSQYNLQAGDILRYETATKEQLKSTKNKLISRLPNWNQEILFFDLDSSSLSHYDKKILH